MARQARNYLAGAVSGTALIGMAMVAFVMLVSLQTLRSWPLAGIGGGDSGSSSVALGRAATTRAAASTPGGEVGNAPPAAGGPGPSGRHPRPAGRRRAPGLPGARSPRWRVP